MDYQELYNIIEDSVSEEQKNDLNLIVNIYLVATGVRTAYLTVDQEFTEATKKLNFIVYRLVKFDDSKKFEFAVNKDFYKKYSYLFDELDNTKIYSSEYHQILGKILNYPCAGDYDKLQSEDFIVLKFFVKKDSIEGHLHNYVCPDEDIHIENAEAYLNKMKSVLNPLKIKAIMKFNKREASLTSKYRVLFRDILEAIKDIWSEDLTYVYALNILITSISTIKPISIFDDSDTLVEKIQTNPTLLDKLKSISNILVEYGPYYGPYNVNKFIVINKKLYPEIKSQLEKLTNQKFIERGKRDKIIGKLLGYDYVLDLEEFNKSKEPYYTLRYKIINEKEYILYVNSVPIDSSLKKATDKLKILNDILYNLNLKVKMDLEFKYRMLK
jgi:hypothetical protein